MRSTVALLLLTTTLAACSDDEGSTGSAGGGGGSGGATTGSDGGGAPASTTGGDGGSTSTGSGATTTSAGPGGAGGTGGDGSGGSTSSTLEGYWVWTKQVENGAVTLEITDADMEPKVGPGGWPGCPEGILCTRYGIHKVAFGDGGRLHQQHNVTTSSDFQTLGTWADASGGAATFQREEQFSCAHPDAVNADVVPGGFRYRHEAGELWISVSGFGGFPFVDPGAEPTTWLVYKPVTRDDYYGKYMIRVCQPFDDHTCHEGCFDTSLVDEP